MCFTRTSSTRTFALLSALRRTCVREDNGRKVTHVREGMCHTLVWCGRGGDWKTETETARFSPRTYTLCVCVCAFLCARSVRLHLHVRHSVACMGCCSYLARGVFLHVCHGCCMDGTMHVSHARYNCSFSADKSILRLWECHCRCAMAVL